MSPEELSCWKCGANLKSVPLPYGRRSECPACRAELHVCRMCHHFAPGKAKQCMEPMAEDVLDKTRGNHCDWFQPTPRQPGKVDASRAVLNDLFGDSAPVCPPRNLDDLFG